MTNPSDGIYISHAVKAAKVFKEYGALSLVECWGEKYT